MKYWVVYKCPLCGKLSASEDSIEIPQEALSELMGKVVRNQSFSNNPYLYKMPMHIICNCTDGSAGLAQFAGFKKDTSQQDKELVTFLRKILNM